MNNFKVQVNGLGRSNEKSLQKTESSLAMNFQFSIPILNSLHIFLSNVYFFIIIYILIDYLSSSYSILFYFNTFIFSFILPTKNKNLFNQ